MKLVHTAPTGARHTTEAADRTFTLSHQAYAAILNLANRYDADTLDQTPEICERPAERPHGQDSGDSLTSNVWPW